MPIRVLPKTPAPAPAQGTRGRGIMDAFQRYGDRFEGTSEDKMDLDIAKAMKEPGSSTRMNVWMKAIDMANEGRVPTRDMFRSDEEFRYFQKVYTDAVDVVENMGTPAFEKEDLGKRIIGLEDQLATAQAGGIGLDRITQGYKHPAEMIAMKLRAKDGLYQKNLEKMKEQYNMSSSRPEIQQYNMSSGRPEIQQYNMSSGSPEIKYIYAQGGRAGFAQGGRTGYQAGTSVQQIQPAQFIQDVGYDYAKQLAATTAVPLQTSQFAPAVAQQTGLQQQATQDVTAGLGAYQPYLTGAGTAGVTAPGAAAMGAQAYTGLGQAAGLTGTGAGTGAGSIASYMSPYQQQVIDTSLAEFDRQAAMRQQGISDAAVQLGGYGGGREGVMQAEYQTQSDRNSALLEAQMQQQGFGQAAGLRQQDYLNQMGLAQAQQGLGSYQAGLGAATQQQLGADVGLAGRVGSANQAQAQAELDAIREANRLAAYEPIERLGMYGTGVTGLMGGYPGQYQFSSQPGPTPLQSALGIASVAGGLYGNIYGPMRPKTT